MSILKKTYKTIIPERLRLSIRNTLTQSTYPFYLGDKHTCNCCGKSFRKLLPKGNIIRKNAKCPACFSLERTRVLDFYLSNEINIYNQKDINILHFAPEEILFKKLSKIKHINYIDADLNPALANTVVDITNIQFENNTFDYIICSHVLGHVPNEQKAISELLRVLKPDGIALIMTTIDDNLEESFEDVSIQSEKDRLLYYGEHDLARKHGKDFQKRIEKNGFKVNPIDYRQTFDKEKQHRFSLGDGKREVIFVCTK